MAARIGFLTAACFVPVWIDAGFLNGGFWAARFWAGAAALFTAGFFATPLTGLAAAILAVGFFVGAVFFAAFLAGLLEPNLPTGFFARTNFFAEFLAGLTAVLLAPVLLFAVTLAVIFRTTFGAAFEISFFAVGLIVLLGTAFATGFFATGFFATGFFAAVFIAAARRAIGFARRMRMSVTLLLTCKISFSRYCL